jgi:hypothetical protein
VNRDFLIATSFYFQADCKDNTTALERRDSLLFRAPAIILQSTAAVGARRKKSCHPLSISCILAAANKRNPKHPAIGPRPDGNAGAGEGEQPEMERNHGMVFAGVEAVCPVQRPVAPQRALDVCPVQHDR